MLTVRDTGTGIPAGELPRLFERFHRVEGAARPQLRRHRHRAGAGAGAGAAAWRPIKVESRARTAARPSAVARSLRHRPSAGVQARSLAPRGRRRSPTARASAFVEEALRWLPGIAGDEEFEPTRDLPDAARCRNAGEKPRVLLADDNADMRDYVARLLAAATRSRPPPTGRRRWRRRSARAARPRPDRRDDAAARRLRPASRRSAPSAALRDLPGHPAVGAGRRGGEHRGAGRRRGRLSRQAVLGARAARAG